MANLYISEHAEPPQYQGEMQPCVRPPLTTQKVAFTGTAGTSSAFNTNTRIIRVQSDAVASIAIGTAPTATADDPRIAAGESIYFWVGDTASLKISAITNS